MIKPSHWTDNLDSCFQVFLNVHLMLTVGNRGGFPSVLIKRTKILIPNTYL